jgi:hypothetical protein
MIDMVQLNPCSFPGRYNPASGKSCQVRSDGFREMNSVATPTMSSMSVIQKENPSDIYGSLAGSSGLAYQTTHRSPLSYNIDITKSSPMTELNFDTFQPNEVSSGTRDTDSHTSSYVNAREVITRHNQNASSFYKEPISTTHQLSGNNTSSDDNDTRSFYDDLVNQLSSLMERTSHDDYQTSGEDLSTIRGDVMSQIYYYGVSVLLLYVFYRLLYKKRN